MNLAKAPPDHRMPPICLFGGTFDPVHEGHLGMARAAHCPMRSGSRHFSAMPAVSPQDGSHFRPADDRVDLLRLAVEGLCGRMSRRGKSDRPAPSYSWEAVDILPVGRPGPAPSCPGSWERTSGSRSKIGLGPVVLARRLHFIVFSRGDSKSRSLPAWRSDVSRRPASRRIDRGPRRRQVGTLSDGLVPPAVAPLHCEHELYRD